VSPVPEAPVAGDHTSSTGRRHVSREIGFRVTGLAAIPDQYEGRHTRGLAPKPNHRVRALPTPGLSAQEGDERAGDR